MCGMTILVGNIASGKSTICKKLASEGHIIVNDDAVVNLIHADQYVLYEQKLKSLYKYVEHAIIQFGLGMGRNVVVDRPNLKRDTRKRFIEIARSFEVPAHIIVMPMRTPEEHAKKRCEQDARGWSYEHWLKVATVRYEGYEKPDKDIEGFDSIEFL